METYRIQNPTFLGQATVTAGAAADPGSGVQLDRALAEYGLSVIQILTSAQVSTPEVVSVPCWRKLLVLRRAEVEQLQDLLVSFLESDTPHFMLPPAKYDVFDEVIACEAEIADAASEEKSASVESIATVIGILGGIAALVAIA